MRFAFLLKLLVVLIFNACQPKKSVVQNVSAPLNVVWLVAEDLSPYIPPFGDSTVQTPNLSRLAAEGILYNNVYSVAGVCSPSRAALATGMYPSSIGAHHMRTLSQQAAALERGLINYECVPPPQVKMVSELLREYGYYCTNNSKEDYQFQPSEMAWDESSIFAHWRNRAKGQPFFSIFNFNVTHESQIFKPVPSANFFYNNDTFPPHRGKLKREHFAAGVEKKLLVAEDLQVKIPPYLPNTPLVEKDIRRMYSNIIEMDKSVGKILQQLEEDGLLENTIVVWYSDHGGPLPRQKRLLYDSGLKVPMIIRYPKQKEAGTQNDKLISFVDFAPTLLSMLNIKPPDYMQGQAFDGNYKTDAERKYVYAAADRLDEWHDMIRAVRDKRFKYLKNFYPDRPYYLAVEYRERMATMQELLRLEKEGKLNSYQQQWFRTSKEVEELFDTKNDPHELHNLAAEPEFADKLVELRTACEQWMQDIEDKGLQDEGDMIEEFWKNKIQPVTATPSAHFEKRKLNINCATEGASIGYKFPADERADRGWRIYKKAIPIADDVEIKIVAHRIGYAPSDTLIVKN